MISEQNEDIPVYHISTKVSFVCKCVCVCVCVRVFVYAHVCA